LRLASFPARAGASTFFTPLRERYSQSIEIPRNTLDGTALARVVFGGISFAGIPASVSTDRPRAKARGARSLREDAMRFRKTLAALCAAGGGLLASGAANATLTLTASGVTDGFTLTTYFSEPTSYYGLLGMGTTSSGQVVAAGYGNDTLNLLNDTDGQTASTILKSVSLSGIGLAYSVATVGGNTYFATGGGGAYYKVNTTTLALTPLALKTPVTPYLGLWANQVTGDLISSSYSGLVDINPITGAVHVITTLAGFDGVTVSPDGKTVYGEYGGNIYAYDIASGTLLASYSGGGHAPDGTGVISGGTFNGDIIVNNNDGTVGMINPGTGIETIIATGGTRGDFVSPDLTNGTLFLASADAEERLKLAGASIGGGGGGNGVPEPGMMLLCGIALAGLGGGLLRRRTPKS
jgi:hypothetical protein